MIDDKQKIDIAKKFALLHPEPFAMWAKGKENTSDDEYYLTVFDDLIAGVYGDCYGINAEFDGEGNQIQEATKYEIDVDRFELSDVNPEIFYFEVKLGQVSGDRIIAEYEIDGI